MVYAEAVLRRMGANAESWQGDLLASGQRKYIGAEPGNGYIASQVKGDGVVESAELRRLSNGLSDEGSYVLEKHDDIGHTITTFGTRVVDKTAPRVYQRIDFVGGRFSAMELEIMVNGDLRVGFEEGADDQATLKMTNYHYVFQMGEGGMPYALYRREEIVGTEIVPTEGRDLSTDIYMEPTLSHERTVALMTRLNAGYPVSGEFGYTDL